MKRLLSFILVGWTLALCLAVPAYSAEQYRYIGDVDGDDAVTILDATAIQKYLVSIHPFSKLQKYLGDVDNSKTTDILDATLIQKKLASIPAPFYRERINSWKSEIYSIESSNLDGAYLTDTQYIFTINATAYPIPDDYRILVDDDVIQENGENKSFSYTFSETGVHSIRAYCFGAFGSIDTCLLKVIVTDPNASEKPTVDTVLFDRATGKVEASASGGTAPYRYCYTIRQVPPPPPEPEVSGGYEFVFKEEQDGSYYLYCDFCDGEEVYVPVYHLTKNLYYQLEVQALDSKGVISEVKSIYIQK